LHDPISPDESKIALLKEGALNAYEYHDHVNSDEQILAFVQVCPHPCKIIVISL
jgi:hypothetical protein